VFQHYSRRFTAMPQFIRLGLTLLIAVFALALPSGTNAASGPPTICTADLVIFTTSPGTITTTGQVTHAHDSGVGGQYTSGFLAGYTLSGAQDIVVNNVTHTSQLHGQFTATGPGGSLTIRYTGHADLTTGAATGNFVSSAGTGQFADFHWQGRITAQLISTTPPTFIATDSGFCHPAP
jgi:hypothetical protein